MTLEALSLPWSLPFSLPVSLFLALATGIALGGLFYGGLWYTVRRAAHFRHSGAAMLASALLRMAIVLGGFYLVAAGDWRRMLLCLLGFMAARLAITWATRLPAPTHAAGHRHAP